MEMNHRITNQFNGSSGDPDRYRELLLSLLGMRGRPETLWVLLTSAVRGEGVTTIACGLSAAMAESGPTVFVELNWRHPSPELAALGRSVFLKDAFLGGGPPGAAAGGQGVTVIRARPGETPEDLGSLPELVAKLRSRFRFGVLDTPPVLSYPDALALGGSVDGCVLVVESGKTPWQAAERARDLVQSVGLTPLGIVLNKRSYPIPPKIYKRLS